MPDAERKTISATLTATYLRGRLSYDPKTGIFRWRTSAYRNCPAVGSIAGSLDRKSGYWQIRLGPNNYLAHRLAWFYMTGEWPKEDIDHKDRCRSNNRWANLRAATRQQTRHNSGARKNGTAGGIKGASLDQPHIRRKKWKSTINVNGKHISLGRFHTREEANRAYAQAAKKYFGEYASA